MTALLPSETAVTSVGLAPDETLLSVGRADGHISIVSPLLKKSIADFAASNDPIIAARFAGSVNTLISVSESGLCRTWQVSAAVGSPGQEEPTLTH